MDVKEKDGLINGTGEVVVGKKTPTKTVGSVVEVNREINGDAKEEIVEKKVDNAEVRDYNNDRVEEELRKIKALRVEMESQVTETRKNRLHSEVNASDLGDVAKQFLIKNFIGTNSTPEELQSVITEFKSMFEVIERKPKKGNFDFASSFNSKHKTSEKVEIGSREYGKMLAKKNKR